MRIIFVFLSVCVISNSWADLLSSEDIVEALAPSAKVRGIVVEKDIPRSVDLTIYFDFNSATILSKSEPQLRNLAEGLGSVRLAERKFQVIGHTDSVGSQEYNLRLSEARASSVVNFLVLCCGLRKDRISAIGKGKSQPLDGSNPADAINRRVEIRSLPM